MESSTPRPEEVSISGTEQNETGTKKRRPTEKRKLQNRIAQRKYRDSLKSRLENLERQAAEIASQQSTAVPGAGTSSQPEAAQQNPEVPESVTSSSALVLVCPQDDEASHVAGSNVQVETIDLTTVDPSTFDFMPDMEPGSSANRYLPVDTGAFEFFNDPGFPNLESIFESPIEPEQSTSSRRVDDSFNEPSSLNVDFEYDFYINQLSSEVTPLTNNSNQSNQSTESNRPKYAPWGPTHFWSANGKSPAKSIDNFVRLTPDPGTVSKMTMRVLKEPENSDTARKIAPTFSADLIRQLRLDDSKENQSLIRTAIARNYNIRDVFLAGLAALDKQENLQPRTGFDPYKNTLTLIPTSSLQAYLSNAMALKLPISGLKNEAFQSPFYQPEAYASGNMAALEVAWNELPKALRPTPAQITQPHHPWMDMIPFPTIRERALTLSSLDPPMIDIYDLKNDVFMNSGIFCWRVGGSGGSGQPWDMRSWEAEPWFLQKWWILVGGETGGVWEQTQWWRGMRGKPKVEMTSASS
ncbi:uncharacterized protein PAC_01740 [Phialocephala subalpina]|uniref:BZIP domain-containing protein n=1 Tax=Phialocephala subalpina TaxID=576137 RepID=A0A1L7WGI8_9HELO|nr:uncharacterized protein PAC_01740 [Phialocephala subalpina]